MTNKYINILDEDVLELEEDVEAEELESLKLCVLEQMREEQKKIKRFDKGKKEKGAENMRNNSILRKVAVAAVAIAIATPTVVYASEKWNLFGGLFGGSDTTPIEPYVESIVTESANGSEETVIGSETVQGTETPIYHMENDKYIISVEKFVYSEATDYGIVQFSVTDKSDDDSNWYQVATWEGIYNDWDVIDIDEIFAGMEDGQMKFEVNGLMCMNGHCYAEQRDENTKVCYLAFNDMEGKEIGGRDLKLSVKEAQLVKRGEVEDLLWNPLTKLDVPVGESLPNYTWLDEEGNVELVLTPVDFLLKNVPETSVSGVDVILREVSVQFKDGSEYIVHSEKQKTIDWLYATSKDGGSWRSFAKVVDLDNVKSFTADGRIFAIEDAVK